MMKRPSEVPPLVDNSGSMPVTACTAARTAPIKSPAGVRKARRHAPSRVRSRAHVRAEFRAAALQAFHRACRRIAEIEIHLEAVGGDIDGAVPPWMLENLPAGWRKRRMPRSHSVVASSASAGANSKHGILQLLRIRDMALHALDYQFSGEGAAPAVLDVSPSLLRRWARRLCSNRAIRARLELFHHPGGASTATPSSSEVSSSAIEPRCCGCAATNSSAAQTKAAIEDFMSPRRGRRACLRANWERKGIGQPFIQRAGGTSRYVRQTHQRFGLAAARAHRLLTRRSARSPGRSRLRFRRLGDDILAAGIIRRDRTPAHQLLVCEFPVWLSS